MRLNAQLRRLEGYRCKVAQSVDPVASPYDVLRKLPYTELIRLYNLVIQTPVTNRVRPQRARELARLPYKQLLEMYTATVGNFD